MTTQEDINQPGNWFVRFPPFNPRDNPVWPAVQLVTLNLNDTSSRNLQLPKFLCQAFLAKCLSCSVIIRFCHRVVDQVGCLGLVCFLPNLPPRLRVAYRPSLDPVQTSPWFAPDSTQMTVTGSFKIFTYTFDFD